MISFLINIDWLNVSPPILKANKMEFEYLDKDKNHPLIEHFYQLKMTEEDLPFKSIMLPTNLASITCNYGNQQYMIKDNYNATITAKDIDNATIIDDLYKVVLSQQ